MLYVLLDRIADILVIVAALKFIFTKLPTSYDVSTFEESFRTLRDEAKRLTEEVIELRRLDLSKIERKLDAIKARSSQPKHPFPLQ